MALKATYRCFRLRLGLGYGIVRGIGSVEPYSGVGVEDPVTPALGIAKFRLKGPAIDSPIDKLGGTVLTRGRHDLDARAQNHLLLPFGELLGLHSWAAHK